MPLVYVFTLVCDTCNTREDRQLSWPDAPAATVAWLAGWVLATPGIWGPVTCPKCVKKAGG